MALIAAFVFQALALHNGLISVVQPVLATELVFVLVLRWFWIHQSIRLVTWSAAAVTCVGLTVFIAAGQPGGGNPTPTGQHWFTAGLACCAAGAVLAVLARWGSPSQRATLYGSACAVMWALVATFIKATTDTLTQFGVGGMFTHWPIYALAVGSVAALFLEQAALQVGPLRASQPFIVIVDPIVSIALSLWLFAEHFTSDSAVLAVAAVGLRRDVRRGCRPDADRASDDESRHRGRPRRQAAWRGKQPEQATRELATEMTRAPSGDLRPEPFDLAGTQISLAHA